MSDRSLDPGDEALADRITAAYHRVWASVGELAGVAPQRDDELLLVSTGTPAPPFNRAFVLSDPADPAAALARARAFFGPLPFLFETWAGCHPRAEAEAARQGLQSSGSSPAMVLPLAADALRPGGGAALPAAETDLIVTEVTTPAELAVNLAVQAEGFDAPLELMAAIFGPVLAVENVRCFTGSSGGVPVATSLLAFDDGLAGIYSVATVPDARRRGFGEKMTAFAARVGAAEHGCDTAYLQASQMGRPVYDRMGFRELASYRSVLCAP